MKVEILLLNSRYGRHICLYKDEKRLNVDFLHAKISHRYYNEGLNIKNILQKRREDFMFFFIAFTKAIDTIPYNLLRS